MGCRSFLGFLVFGGLVGCCAWLVGVSVSGFVAGFVACCWCCYMMPSGFSLYSRLLVGLV